MNRRALALVGVLLGCSVAPHLEEHPAPSSVDNPVAESELTRVRLTPEAVQRLAIETAVVQQHKAAGVRRLGGEVIVPPGRVLTVAAPVAGLVRADADAALVPGMVVQEGQQLLRLVPLAPVDRDTRARATREVQAARAALEAAQARLSRTLALAAERAGSQRAVEEATASRDIALADLEVAQARRKAMRSSPLLSDVSMSVRAPEDGVLRAVSIAAGQSVAAGTPLLEVVAVDELWVRAAVDSADLHRLAPQGDANVEPLAGQPGADTAGQWIAGPPTSSPALGTVDRYFALGAASSRFHLGERVMLSLPLRRQESRRAIPYSAVLYDAHGSEWVYVCDDEGLYRRARVELLHRTGDTAVLLRGPEVGTCVVSVGAAEIFGAEFEPGH